MKIRAMIALTLILASQTALAAVDYKCLNDCTQAGHMYSYCKKLCSY